MTTDQTPRIFHVSFQHGDDRWGNGSTEFPFATVERAEQVDPDAALFINGEYNLPAPPDWTPPRDYTGDPLSMSDSAWLVFALTVLAFWVGFVTLGWTAALIGSVIVALIGGSIVANRSRL